MAKLKCLKISLIFN